MLFSFSSSPLFRLAVFFFFARRRSWDVAFSRSYSVGRCFSPSELLLTLFLGGRDDWLCVPVASGRAEWSVAGPGEERLETCIPARFRCSAVSFFFWGFCLFVLFWRWRVSGFALCSNDGAAG